MLCSVALLSLCYAPQMIANPMLSTKPENFAYNWIIVTWSNIFVYSNSLFNPIWYCLRLQGLKKRVLRLLRLEKLINQTPPVQRMDLHELTKKLCPRPQPFLIGDQNSVINTARGFPREPASIDLRFKVGSSDKKASFSD